MRSGTSSNPFEDMEGHWALPYTGRLSELGILQGVSSTTFAPDQNITRGDFALMTARWLGLNLEDYAGVDLPYADATTSQLGLYRHPGPPHPGHSGGEHRQRRAALHPRPVLPSPGPRP